MSCPHSHARGDDVRVILAQLDPSSHVYAHAAFFANAVGTGSSPTLTHDTMHQKHAAMGDAPSTLFYKLTAILNVCRGALGAVPATNPSSTGLWGANGVLNAERFNVLRQHATTVASGERVYDRSAFDALRAKTWSAWVPLTWVWLGGVIPLPVTSKAVTDGSLGEMFKYFSDATAVVNGTRVPVMTEDRVYAFYTESPRLMRARIDALATGTLPAIREL